MKKLILEAPEDNWRGEFEVPDDAMNLTMDSLYSVGIGRYYALSIYDRRYGLYGGMTTLVGPDTTARIEEV